VQQILTVARKGSLDRVACSSLTSSYRDQINLTLEALRYPHDFLGTGRERTSASMLTYGIDRVAV